MRNRVGYTEPFINNRLVIGERSIQHRGPTMWLDIPDSVKLSESFSSFKKQLKAHLLSSNQ